MIQSTCFTGDLDLDLGWYQQLLFLTADVLVSSRRLLELQNCFFSLFYFEWKYGALSWLCFVVAGFVSFILDDGSALRAIPLLRLEKTGDILGEYLDDFGVRSFPILSSSLGRQPPNLLVDMFELIITISYSFLPFLNQIIQKGSDILFQISQIYFQDKSQLKKMDNQMIQEYKCNKFVINNRVDHFYSNFRGRILSHFFYQIVSLILQKLLLKMIIDQVIWNVIKNKHCSFRMTTVSQNFCKNEYNLTGLCNRKSCPLANSQYATVKQEKGVCYLYMKTAQRAHLPSQLWQKVRLNKSYHKALEQIDQQLIYWSPFIIHKCKQRLTKLRQMIIQMRKLKLQGKEELVPIKKKAQKRDRIRQAKALIAANIEQKIQEELMQRLKTGVYKDIYNYNPKAFNKLVGKGQEEQAQENMQEQNEDQFIAQEDEEYQQQMQQNAYQELQF